MNDDSADDSAVEQLIKQQFGLEVSVKQMIARSIPVSHTATAHVFLTPKHQAFALIQARSPLVYGEVRNIAKKMNLEVETFMPPGNDGDYFNRIARERFRVVFPGRHDIADDELHYYRTLVPYNPALLKIDTIIGGTIKQFDSHDSSGWRIAAKFAYKQIMTA